MWCAHTATDRTRDRQRRGDQADVAEDRLAAEHRQDLGDDAEERQRDDVDLGMPEEPEQVLPQQWPAVRRVEDVSPEGSIRLQHQQRAGQDRERDQHQDRRDQDVPGEDRHPEHRHPGRAHGDDRGDEVDRTEDRAQTGHPQAHDPQVTADTRRADRVGQRGVGEPAEVGRAARGEEAAEGDQAAEQEQPVAEHVQPRERDVRGADLDRHDHVREADEQRRREQQQHDRAVHGEELVVDLFVHDLQTRLGQLGPDQQRHHAADQEERERGDQVQVADQLVVGGGQPLDRDLALAAPPGQRRRGRTDGAGALGDSRSLLALLLPVTGNGGRVLATGGGAGLALGGQFPQVRLVLVGG